MSTDYRPLTTIAEADLFDGRLKEFGIHEHLNKNFLFTADGTRLLIDGRDHL